MKKERLHKTTSFSVSGAVIIFILVLIALITLYPFVYTLAGSFNDGTDFEKGGVWLFPRVFTLDNYTAVFSDYRLWIGLGNTVLRTVVGTAAALIVTSCVAYAMSQRELPCKRFFRVFNVITMFFSGGIVPFFLVVNILGLYDNFLVYILPSLYSVYNMIVISTFFRGIGQGVREAAILDGASEMRIWWSVFMPMSTPVLATVGLWIAVMHWNSYLPTLLYTSKDESMWTLQYYLMRIIKDAALPEGDAVNENVTAQTISFAAMFIAMIPIVCVYPFLQKYFAKGAALGSLKE